jgi:tetratricopeptide (TPR) repeat protein
LSVEHLGRLLEQGEYRRCLEAATHLLAYGGQDQAGLARIQAAICRSRLALTDFTGALSAGEMALELATRSTDPDLLGFATLDLAAAQTATRQYEAALSTIARYFADYEHYIAARCLKGAVLRQVGDTLLKVGRSEEALDRYRQAHEWFERFGDEESAQACTRAMVLLHLDRGETRQAVPLLLAGDRYALDHPADDRFRCDHLLDRSLLHLVSRQHETSIAEAFEALLLVQGRLDQQARAQLILCQNGLAQNRLTEALSFALAARISAIDGRMYELEFEASELLFRLLRERGLRLLADVDQEYMEQGINIYHYLSEPVLKRMFHSN